MFGLAARERRQAVSLGMVLTLLRPGKDKLDVTFALERWKKRCR